MTQKEPVTNLSENQLRIADTTDAYRDVSVGEDAHRRAESLRRRFFVALPLGVAVMALSMIPVLQFPGWQWVVAVAVIPVVTWCAWPFHRAAFAAARHGSTTMDTLVSIGIIASAGWSYWALLWGGAGHIGMKMNMSLIPRFTHTDGAHAELYFEAAAMIVVFLLAGRWAEARTRYRAGDALRALLDLGAKEATLITKSADGALIERVVPASTLEVGDHFLVRPGEKVATDGTVQSGSSALDASLLTGESIPVDVGPGDSITGGTINTWGSLQVRATRVGSDTTLAQIGRMVTEAQATKAPVQRLADKISAVFVPVIIAVAVITLATWILLGQPLQAAFTAAVAVLVVACPCALGLATPTALLVGSGRASQLGILIRNAEVLEQTRRVDVACLDKTGTITTGSLRATDIFVAGQIDPTSQSDAELPVLAAAAAVESGSEHPLARAIYRSATERGITPSASSGFTNYAGKGVSATLVRSEPDEGVTSVLVGGTRWLSRHGVELSPPALKWQQEQEQTGATVVAVVTVPDSVLGGVAPVDSSSDGSPESPRASALQVSVAVSGMTCASCVGRVERKLKKLPGVHPQVNLATETATIGLDQDYTNEELTKVIEDAGYGAIVLDRSAVSQVAAPRQQARELPASIIGASLLGLIALRDSIKPDSRAAISEMKAMGISPVLLTGDNLGAAHHVAQQVGIERVVAEVLPEEKHREVERLQGEGHVVAMIGDGVNDAAAMAQASQQGLGIAMGSGTDVAMAVADITLVNSDLESAPRAIRISRRTLGVIKGNLFWAFFYNVLAVPLACLGLLNPMIAAAAMAFSSVFVVLNSLRLRNAG